MSSTNDFPDVLTLDEAAAYLRVPSGEVQALLEARRIPARQIGSQWRILKAALANWLSDLDPKTRLESLFGAWADDESVPELLRDIYKRRGRSEVEPKPKRRKAAHASARQ